MTQIQMPPGCNSLRFPPTKAGPGKEYYGKPGGSVSVDDHHAVQIAKSPNGRLGIVTQPRNAIGTRKGQRCEGCGFLGQAWMRICNRCGGTDLTEE